MDDDEQFEEESYQESDRSSADDEDEGAEGELKTEFIPNADGSGTKVEQRITSKYLSKYERARILGARALQISKNAPIMVEVNENEIDPLIIAERELMLKRIPFIIRRYLPSGNYEDWTLDEMIID
eukprot:Mrub_14310.p2 GENE.Mrub_14310~~Mrub_14310.p2  ORF type:complete len:139 (+),score=27.43 Mrub_14310:40-417(+)